MQVLSDLKETVAKLRDPEGGCPWDLAQTHKSLCACLIEEVAEVLDTIDREDTDHMREELGDLLLQVMLHAQIAEEGGVFTVEDVIGDLNAKLVRRHPHVFGDVKEATPEAALARWDAVKAEEKKARGESIYQVFKDLPPRLPALFYARDVFKQIVKKQLPLPESVDMGSIDQLADELTENEVGERLFLIAAACRKAGVDPESALRRYTDKVINNVERLV